MKKTATLLFVLLVFQSFGQKKITSIPFELFGDHMFIKVSIDGSRPLDFIFDTGSGLTVVDRDVADNLGLDKREIRLNDIQAVFELTKHNRIDINGFNMEKNINVYTTRLKHLEISLGRDFDGILGYDLLNHHIVHIDYDKLTMDIYNHGDGPEDGDAIPFKLMTTIPTIKGKVTLNNGERYDGLFFVMTGAGTTLDFNSPFSKKWNVIHKTGKHYSYPVKGISEIEKLYYEGHVLSFEFGKQVVENLPIGISTATDGIQGDKNVAGIIGNRILREFNITIDVPNKMIWIKKNSHYGEKFNINSSGIDLQMANDLKKVMIHKVFENSPASKAGIRTNDELVMLNGKPVQDYELPNIKTILRRSGETVDLVIRQGVEEKEITLQLKSLIE